MGGEHDGKPAFIPWITLYSCKSDLTFILACHQFPVHLALAMTINKSQGQSVKHVGIDLCTPGFTHGQLYVALSMATAKKQIYVLFPQGEAGTQTQNVVSRSATDIILNIHVYWTKNRICPWTKVNCFTSETLDRYLYWKSKYKHIAPLEALNLYLWD